MCQLDPRDAAKQVGEVYFKNLFLNNKELKTVRENVKKSGKGIIGSGYGWTLNHTFAASGLELAVQLFLDKGADPEAQSKQGTLLNVAALCGNEGTVKLLLAHNVNLEARSRHGYTALNFAAMNGYTKIVELLLDKKAQIETRDNDGNTPLMTAAQNNKAIVVELLLARGANKDARNAQGKTALELLKQIPTARVVDFVSVQKAPTIVLLRDDGPPKRD